MCATQVTREVELGLQPKLQGFAIAILSTTPLHFTLFHSSLLLHSCAGFTESRKTGVKLHQFFHMHTLTALSNWETGFETPPNHRIINVWAWSDLFSSIGPWNLTHHTGLQSLCHGRYVLRFRQRGTWSFSHSARQCSVGFLVWIIACILWRGEKFHLHSMELRWESIA